jgi:hypothetical protein
MAFSLVILGSTLMTRSLVRAIISSHQPKDNHGKDQANHSDVRSVYPYCFVRTDLATNQHARVV